MKNSEPVLEIEDLTVAYRQQGRWQEAVRHASLRIMRGQTYALVGESGSGKSTLALAVMRYLPKEGQVRGGTIRFNGRDLLQLDDAQMRPIWGAQMALLPQDPLSSLNPTLRLGEQISELIRHHKQMNKQQAQQRALELLEMVRLSDPERVIRSYPHEISGGMLQRVLMAMAVSTEPLLLVLDEPTSSLDVTTQASVLDLVAELIREQGMSVLYITHNLGVVAQICDRVAVMYAGELVEDAPTEGLYHDPLHPYTWGLLDSVPRLGQNKAEIQLRPIGGRIPSLDELPEGCIFRPRCPLAIEVCREYPPLYDAGEGRSSRCHRWEEIARGEIGAHQPAPAPSPAATTTSAQGTVLEIQDVKVHFLTGRSIIAMLKREADEKVKAVDGVSLEVPRAKTLGLVGESGSGKTTLARAIVGLVSRTEGSVTLEDEELPPGLKGRTQEVYRHVQMVFQNPQEAFNPYRSVGETLRRPVIHLLGKSDQESDEIVKELLDAVHLPAEFAARLPGQLSGGEKQRVAIARAFASNPALLIADEPVTALDVSVQASILNLLNELQAEHHSSTLFISHDLAVVGYLADVIAVIYLGQLMETAPARTAFDPPYHPYTEALLSSVPMIDPQGKQENIRLEGEIPSPTDEVTGCPFHTRCPRFLGDICVEKVPPWRVDEKAGKRIFCHIPIEELRDNQKRPFSFSQPLSE